MTPRRAWLLGIIAGDGHISLIRYRHASFGIQVACGLSEPLAQLVAEAMTLELSKLAKVRTVPAQDDTRQTTYNAEIWSRAITEDIASRYFPDVVLLSKTREMQYNVAKEIGIRKTWKTRNKETKTHTWRMPEQVWQDTDECLAAWVAGLFDSDGCVNHSQTLNQRSAVFTSVSSGGAKDVAAALVRLGVNHTYSTHTNKNRINSSTEHRLRIGDQVALKKFSEIVLLRHPDKAVKLLAAVQSYKRKPLAHATSEEKQEEIRQWLVSSPQATRRDIAIRCAVTLDQVRHVMTVNNITRRTSIGDKTTPAKKPRIRIIKKERQ